MRKLKPSVKAAIASTLVLTSAAAIAYAVPKVSESSNKSTGNELKLEVERIDSDTVKVAIDNIQDIPKALQFSIKLDGAKLQDGEKSIKDLVKSEVETRLKNKEYSTNTNSVLTDYTYNEKDNTIDILITAENSLPKVGNKVEIFELDVEAASKDVQTYKVLPNDTSNYKYVSNTNKEYNNLGVTSDNTEISLDTLPTITVDDSYIMIVEGETLELTPESLKEKIGLQMSHEDGNDNLTLEIKRDGKVIESTFKESTVGIYELELRAVKNGTIKSEPIKLTVNVALDKVTEPPTITMNGEELKDITLDGGSTFKPLENVKAVDKNGRDVEVTVKVDKELDLDPEQDTTYILTYTATDIYGNTATKKINLNVKANKAPVISGVKDHVIKVGDKFDPTEGVTVTDEDKDIELNVDSNVNTSIAGEYKVLYSATDSKGKTTKVQSKVTVNPKTSTVNNAPVITAEDKTIKVGDVFDPKADVKATDKEDGDITDKITFTGKVDTSKAGTYTVKYSVTDSKGATATKTIKVTVEPINSSVINNVPVIAAEDKIIKVGDKFDPKADVTATDKEDGDLTSKITVTGEVDTTKEGTYTVKYSVTDSKGATATKTIKVTVKKDIVLASSITISDKNNNKIYVGGSKTITASINKEADIKNINWKVSDQSIAELKVNGNEATIVAKSEGEVTLTASTTDGSNLSDSITISIKSFENDSEIPSYAKDVIDTDILTPISGLGTEEYPVELEMKNITLDELNTFLDELDKVEYKLMSISKDEEFTVYELKLTNKSILARFMRVIGLTDDTYIKIKVNNSLDNAEEINNKLAKLANDETENPGTSGDGSEDTGTSEGETVEPGKPEDGDEDQGTSEGETVEPGKPEDGDEDQGTSEGETVEPGKPEDGDEDQGTSDDETVEPEKPQNGNGDSATSEENSDTPKTGDASILGYVGLAAIAAGGLFINKKRKNK